MVVEHLVRVVAATPAGTRLAREREDTGHGVHRKGGGRGRAGHGHGHYREGHFVSGLPPEAFHVTKDGAPQTLTAFMSEEIPLELIVALDVSQSMTPSIPVLKTSAKAFLAGLRPEDQVTLLAFNDNILRWPGDRPTPSCGPGRSIGSRPGAAPRSTTSSSRR